MGSRKIGQYVGCFVSWVEAPFHVALDSFSVPLFQYIPLVGRQAGLLGLLLSFLISLGYGLCWASPPVSLQPLKMHCASCALVTSSGHLLRSRQGKKIDQTECVIRMNDAPTRGFGKDVGNRTSLRVIAHSSLQRILRNRNELLNMSRGTVFIFWGPSSYMRKDGKGLVYNNLQLMNRVLPQLKVYMISRHKMLQLDDLFKRETGKDR